MINELEKYICILNDLVNGKIPSARDIHLHLLWLPDEVGHAETIANTYLPVLSLLTKLALKNKHRI